MTSLEEFQRYLPTYLTPESKEELFDGLKQFPFNMDDRFFTSALKESEIIYQGDGLEELLFTNLPDTKIDRGKGIVLSNTCDTNPENKRHYSTNIIYAPIILFEKFIDGLKEAKFEQGKIDSLVENIRKQRVTQIFYLPKGGNLDKEAIVLLDRINNCGLNDILERDIDLRDFRLFTLSNYGLYILVVKVSIHLTRVQENVDRKSGEIVQ